MLRFLNPLYFLATRRQVADMRVQLLEIERIAMTTAAELTQGLTAINTQLTKISRESSTTLQRVQDLQAALDNATVDPEVDAAFQALKVQAQKLDDLVPDTSEIPGSDTVPGNDTVTGNDTLGGRDTISGTVPGEDTLAG